MTDDFDATDFEGADYEEADFAEADYDGTDFDGTDFGSGDAAVDSDLGDLGAEDYQAAAEAMAQEAAQEQVADEDDDHGLSPRDQKYRQQLRSAEAENDRLNGLLESLQAAEIHRLATERLADPADLFRDGLTVADLCGTDGRVDPAKVDGAINELLQAHPHWRAPLAPYRGPLRSGATAVQFDRPTPKFREAFKPSKSE